MQNPKSNIRYKFKNEESNLNDKESKPSIHKINEANYNMTFVNKALDSNNDNKNDVNIKFINNKSFDTHSDNNEERSNDENIKENNNVTECEIKKKQFVPLKGNEGEVQEEENNKEKYNILKNNEEKNKDYEIITNKLVQIDKNIYSNDKEYTPTHEKTYSFPNYVKSVKKYSKRNPKCISKSDAAVLSMFNFELENINIDNLDDDELDKLNLNKIKREKEKEKEKEKENIEEKESVKKNKSSEPKKLNTENILNTNNNINKESRINKMDEKSQSKLVISESDNNSNVLTQIIPKSSTKQTPPLLSYNKIEKKSSIDFSNGETMNPSIERNTKEV